MKMNCIDAACEKACKKPGYVAFRTATSQWRPYAHAVWCSELGGEIVNWHPNEPAKVSVLIGYDGVCDNRDHFKPRVWSPNKLLLAAWTFALGVLLWRIKRIFTRQQMEL